MKPAKIQATCPECDHQFEAKGSCLRHLPKQRVKTAKPRSTKPTRTQLKKRADDLFRDLIKAKGICENCGKPNGPFPNDLECAHGFSRRYLNTRWDERNAWALCRGDHFKFGQRPLEWEAWMRERMGDDQYEEVKRLALSTQKVNLEAVVHRLEQRVREVA